MYGVARVGPPLGLTDEMGRHSLSRGVGGPLAGAPGAQSCCSKHPFSPHLPQGEPWRPGDEGPGWSPFLLCGQLEPGGETHLPGPAESLLVLPRFSGHPELGKLLWFPVLKKKLGPGGGPLTC